MFRKGLKLRFESAVLCRGLNNDQYYFGGSLLQLQSVQYTLTVISSKTPILMIKAPTLAEVETFTYPDQDTESGNLFAVHTSTCIAGARTRA